MEILTVIVAALGLGVAAGATEVSKQAVIDAYAGLKALLQRKYGAQNEVSDALERVEKAPESEGRQAVLAEELTKVEADKDEEVLAAVHKLADTLEATQDTRLQEVVNSFRVEQSMKGRGGRMEQRVSGSSDVKQTMC